MQKRFHDSNKKLNALYNASEILNKKDIFQSFEKPFVSDNPTSNKIFDEWKVKFFDNWKNEIASINSNNSLLQYSEFVRDRLSYAECANLSIDTIINRALTTIVNECLNKGGNIIINDNIDNTSDIVKEIDERLNDLNFWSELRSALYKSLVFGGSLLYFDFGNDDLNNEIKFNYRAFSGEDSKNIKGFKAVEPWLVAPYEVDTANPLNYDYMRPLRWYVSGGGGAVHSSRFCEVVFYDSPDIIKPLFNFFGISLCQFMKDYVKNADSIRQSLSDIFLRFRSVILKTQLVKNNEIEAIKRTKALSKTSNNLGVLLITENEEVSNLITPLSGLDRIQAQAFENMVISSRLPATKLLGISPSGFNSTGEFELSNYYDEISGYQNNIVYPIILKAIKAVAWSMGYDFKLDFVFNKLRIPTDIEEANIRNLNADFVGKNIDNGVFTQEQAFEWIKLDEINRVSNIDFYDEPGKNDNDNDDYLNEISNNLE